MKNRTEAAFARTLARYPALASCRDSISRACELVTDTFQRGGSLLLCGNGGSSSDATHIAGELAKSYLLRRPPAREFASGVAAGLPGPDPSPLLDLEEAVPAISLTTNSALLTAIGNDIGAELVFAQQVMAYGHPGDILFGITTSGGSVNVVRALQTARLRKLSSICLTSHGAPGWLRELVDVVIAAPGETTPEIQEYHLPIYHLLCEAVESELFER